MYADLLLFISLIITIGAQIFVSISYSKYKKVSNGKGISGFEVASKILKDNGLDDIYVIETSGNLTDHYDPSNRVIRLSHDVFHGESISAMAVAAHEASHAIQYKEGNMFIKIRSVIFPLVSFASNFGYFAILLGIILGSLKLFYFGIFLFVVILLFQLLTLPVEFGASHNALKKLKKDFSLTDDAFISAKTVLTAAALTYVASLATSILQIVRLLGLRDRNDR